MHVWTCQWGLGAFERYVAGEGEEWLRGAVECADHLLAIQTPEGTWIHPEQFPHTFQTGPNWISGIAQGEGASLLLRIAAKTGEERYAESARRAIAAIVTPYEEGGVDAPLGDGTWPQEYPTTPPSHVLNGGMSALFGLRDAGVGLKDAVITERFERSVDFLAANLDSWDTGYWSRYDLFPYPLPNVASPAYHQLHIDELRAMNAIAPRAELAKTADCFEAYRDSPVSRARAIAAKLAFRVRTPRNRLLAHKT